MKTRLNENGYIVTDLTGEQKENLLKVEVDDWIIGQEQISKIKDILNLKDANSSEELRAVRNAVVMFLHDYIAKETGRRYLNLMSGTTAVIDNEMVNRFNTL